MNKQEIVSLLKEPSTYAGFAAIALAFGVGAEQFTAVSTGLAAIFGALAAFLPEAKK